MPPRPLETTPAVNPNRPQTLKQAKKAYRKAGASPRFSEIELRRLARAAELQERADRIKEREKKKKINRKKKEEKMEKEREARRKAGVPEIRDAYIGPSQLKLAFPGACGKGKKDAGSSDPSGKELARPDKQGVPESVEAPRISRTPLQPKSPNLTFKPKSPRAPLTDKPCKKSDCDWLDFVVSNTQIEQELSTPKIKCRTVFVSEPLVSASHDEPSDILALISTQDLQSPTKDPPLVLAKVVENHDTPSEASTEDFGSDGVYKDEDVQNLTQDLELKSASKPKSASEDDTISGSKKPLIRSGGATLTEADSFYDEYALSSQELLALVRNNDFDEFDVSTQDLQDLVP